MNKHNNNTKNRDILFLSAIFLMMIFAGFVKSIYMERNGLVSVIHGEYEFFSERTLASIKGIPEKTEEEK